MADETAVTRLIYDATGARQGAAEFHTASQQILDDNRRVEEALARSAATLTAAQGKKVAAHKAATTAANEGATAEIAAAAKSADAVGKSHARLIAALAAPKEGVASALQRADIFTSRLGNVAFEDVRGAQRGVARAAAAIPTENFAERSAGLAGAMGMHVPAGLAPARTAETEISAATTIGTIVPAVLTSIAQHPGDPSLTKLTRTLATIEGNDSTIKQIQAHAHATEPQQPGGLGRSLPGLVGTAGPAVGGEALSGAIVQLSLAIERLRLQLTAEPAAARQAAAAARPLAPTGTVARRVETAAARDESPWLVEPVIPRNLSAAPRGLAAATRDIQRQAALEQRIAHGAVTATQISIPTDAYRRSLGSDLVNTLSRSGDEENVALANRIKGGAADVLRLTQVAPPSAAQVDTTAWLKARQPPNEVDAAAWNKARQGPESLWQSFKNLFPSARSGTADLHGVASAAEHLGAASTHAAGAAHLLGEAHHNARGSIRELGEATHLAGNAADGTADAYEFLRFGIIGLAREFGAPGIGVALAGGALFAGITLLAKRSQETEANLKSFGATLRATGGGGQTSAEELQRLVERLKQTGLAAEEAKKTVDSVTHTAGIAPGAYDQIALLGRNTAAVFGGDAAARAEQWAKAVAGGIGPVIKLASELNLNLSPGEIDAAVAADRLGGSQRALAGLLAASARQIGDARATFTGLKSAFQDLKNAWDELIESLSKSSKIAGATEAVSNALRAAATPTGQNITLGAAGGAVAGVLGGVALRRLGVPIGIARSAALGAGTGAAIEGSGETGAVGAAAQIGTAALVGAQIPGPPQVKAGAAALAATAAAVPILYGSGGPLGTPAEKLAETEAPAWAVQSSAEFGITIDKQISAADKNTEALDRLTAATGAAAKDFTGAVALLPPRTELPAFGNFGEREREGYAGQIPHANLPGEVVPGRLLDALIQVESRGKVDAVNPLNPKPGEEQALGVGQIKLSTARGLAGAEGTTREQLLTDAGLNRQLSSRYLAQMITQFGSLKLGLEAYNAGPRAAEAFRAGSGPEPSAKYAASVLQAAGGAYTGQEKPGELALTAPQIAAPTEEQKKAFKELTEDDREHLRILQSTEGFNRQFQLGYQQIITEERKVADDDQRHKETVERTSTLIKELSQQYNDQARDAGRTADQTERIRKAYQGAGGLAAGQATEAQVAAENKLRLQGGPGTDPYRRQILEQQAQDALKAGYQQLAAAEPVIAAQRELAEATLHGRQVQDEAKIAIEAHAFAQEALIRAQILGITATKEEAAALEQRKAAQLSVAAAIEHTKELGERIQPLQLANRATGFEIGLQAQGLGSEQIRAQTAVFRAQQDIALTHRQTNDPEAAAQQEKTEQAYLGEVSASAQLNVQLSETQRMTERLNEAFTSIASTISGDLTNSIRNALIRTPLEAGQHLKHYWDEFRAGLKQFAGEALSTFANLALVKPLTGTIAAGLGLGETAQRLGTFATGGAMTVPGGGGTDSTHVQFMATPGERVYILTPDQQVSANKSGTFPHFAEGGTLDVGRSWLAAPSWGDPEATGAAQASAAMQPALSSIAAAVGGEARAFGQAGIDLSRAGLQTNADFMAGKEAGGPLLGFRTDTGELTGRLPALAEQVTGGMTGPVALHEIGAGEHAAEAFEHLHQSEETIGSANTGMRFGRVAAGVRGLDETAPEGRGEPGNAENAENYGIDVFGTLGRGVAAMLNKQALGLGTLPMFAGGGEYDPATGDIVNYTDPGLPIIAPSELPAAVPGTSQVTQTASSAAKTYLNDAGQPFTVQNQQFNPISEVSQVGFPVPPVGSPISTASAVNSAANSAGGITAGFFGPLVDLSRKGLQSESAFLSTKAADQPLLGLDTGTGELTGRIPAIADFVQQGLAGGAPAGTLSVGMKLGGEAATAAEDVAGTVPRALSYGERKISTGDISKFADFTIDTAHPPENPEDFRGAMHGAAWYDQGLIEGTHVTDKPAVVQETLLHDHPLADSRGDKYGDLGRGLYFSDSPQIWMSRSTGKWDFLNELNPDQSQALAGSLRDRIAAVPPGYLSQSERSRALDNVDRFESGAAHPSILTELAGQPYNMDFWKPESLQKVGIEPPVQPAQVPVTASGRFARLTRNISDDEATQLKAAGYDGAFTPGGMSTTPQFVVWNNQSIKSFGDWQRPSTGITLGAGAQGDASAAVSTANFAARAAEKAAKPPSIIAYHGSPHDFDRFDISKIGTGEGAQAYGSGLYFAESEGVARSYRNTLAPKPDVLAGGEIQPFITGSVFNEANTAEQKVATRLSLSHQSLSRNQGVVGVAPPPPTIENVIQSVGSDIDSHIALVQRRLEPMEGAGWGDEPFGHPIARASAEKELNSLLAQRAALGKMVDQGIEFAPKGKMYEVGIHADPESFLQWDKPLSEQPKAAYPVFRNLDLVPSHFTDSNIAAISGNSLGQSFTVNSAGYGKFTPAEFSSAMREAGIPGIRYLDQGSRAAGEGTHNIVMFGDENIEILRKYGLAGPPSLAQPGAQPDQTQKPAAGGFSYDQPLPMLAEGGNVVGTGAAIVHAGETILSASSTGQTTDALSSLTKGLQGLSTVVGQATPGFQVLSQAAAKLGGLASVWKAGESVFGGQPGSSGDRAAANPISGAQLAMNVNGLGSGSSVFGANVPGSTVFQSGNIVTVQGGTPAITAPGATPGTEVGGAIDKAMAAAFAPPAAPLGAGASNAPLLETFLGTITSAAADGTQQSLTAAATAAGAPTTFIIPGTGTPIIPAGSLAPELVAAPELPLPTGVSAPAGTPTAAAPASGLITPGNIGGAVSGATTLGSLLSQPGLLPDWLSGAGGAGGLFGAGGITGAINSVSAGGLFATQIPAGEAITQGLGPLAANAAGNVTVPGSLFGSTATLGSALTGAGAGFAAGSLLNSVLGGNQLGGNIGAAGGAIAGSILGTIIGGPVGTLVGGLVGGTAGGGIGGLLGAPPSGQSAGVTIGAGGAQTFEQAGGSAANISASNQVAGQISSFVQQLGQLTDAQGKAIGTIDSGLIAVSSNNTQGIQVSGGNIAGGQFGQNAANAVTQVELQIIDSLTNVSGTLNTIRSHITDPSQLQAAVAFADVYDKLNVTTAQLTANLTGNVNAIGPYSQALTTINQTFTQLTSQATQFGEAVAPLNAALTAVTGTLNTDFKVSIDEAFNTAIDGGKDFIASLVQIHQAYQQNINDAQALATGVPTGTTPAAAAGSASTPTGTILVGEKGPEWMLPRGGGANDWVQVGKTGPEMIDQPGGAVILPNPLTPPTGVKNTPTFLHPPAFAGGVGGISIGGVESVDTRPAFATGTIGAGDIAGQLPGIGSYISEQAGGPSLLEAAGGAAGLSADTLSAIGEALPIAGPILGGLFAAATGHPVQGAIGAAASLIGFAVGGPLGGIIGGLVGLIGNLFGPPPSNKASGDLIDLSTGAITDFQSAGDHKADQIVQGISSGIAAETLLLQQATGGSISGAVSVQDGNRDGIKTSYSGPAGGKIDAKWGSADEAIGQWALAIAHNLVGIDPGLQQALFAVSDPNQLLPVIDAYVAAHTPTAAATTSAAATAPPPPPAPPQLYSITQPTGPSYVGSLTTADVAWWQNAGATLTPYTGAAATARPGATLYQINQTAGPSYVGDLTPADATYWQNAGATLTPYGELPAALPGASLYSITQPGGGPSYLGDLTPPNLTWWQNTGATVAPSDGSKLPTPRQGAALYEITQGTGPWYIGDLMPADAQWWQNAGATVTPFATTAQTVAPGDAPGFAAGTSSTPPGWILVGEQGPEWMHQAGGATVLPSGTMPTGTVSAAGRSFAAGTAADAAASAAAPNATAAITSAIAGTEVAQAGPVLASLGVDQLTTVIQDLGTVAPELAAMAQNLVTSGNALPDILTQGIQALTDPLDLAIQKEKAAGAERVAIATQTGQDLVKVQLLNSANIIAAVISNLNSATGIQAIQYAGNLQAQTTLQAAPVLAGLSGDQLTAVLGKVADSAPLIASLSQQFIAAGTALPDTITQALEAIVDPLKLAIQQQAAQATGRTEVQAATGQNAGEVAALNTASIVQAITQQISNPQTLLALTANGSPQGLAALQAGPTIAGLGADQLTAVLKAIGTAAPDISNMINALISSGNALPDALTQASEAITQAGLLAVQKAQAVGFEQIQTAGAAGQNVGEAQTLAASGVAAAVAQATNTQIPILGIPDWITQIEEAATAPLQLAIQKEQAAGAQRVEIAQATGASLVAIQKANADAIAALWYQATSQLTSLKQQITGGTLSGLTPANQVTAGVEQFNQILTLVQSGNTQFINDLATAGQAAVQAAQTAYGNGPQTASVREQVLSAIQPFLVSASGFPTSGPTALGAAAATMATGTGTTSDLQNNTSALQDLTTAITTTLGGSGALTAASGGGGAPLASAAGALAAAPSAAASASTATAAGPSPSGLATTLGAPTGVPLYNITQPGGGPSYVGDLTPPNVAWWQNAGATVSPYTGTLPTPGAGESLYQITQPGGGPSYIGSLNATNLAWWQNAGATVTPYSAPAATAATPATAAAAMSPMASATQPGAASLTTNPVTGVPFTGNGVTAITPNFPLYPSASTLSNALADAIAGNATASDWASINQALQAGILDPTKQPGYALVIEQAQQVAAGQAVNPGAGLSQALSDAMNGTPTLQEWALINQAVNDGILSPTTQPQYSTIIQRARIIANAQATSLSSIPNTQTAYYTTFHGLPAFAAGVASTPPGPILVGEKGPEIIYQPGGMSVLPHGVMPDLASMPAFSDGTLPASAFELPSQGSSDSVLAPGNERLFRALLMQVQAGNKQAMDDAHIANTHLNKIRQGVGPGLSAPARRAVG